MFFKCKTEKDCKDLFRQLSFKLHPDYSGDCYLMSLLTDAYENQVHCIKLIEESLNEKKKKYESKYTQKYQNTIDDIHFGDPKLDIFKDIIEYGMNHPKFDMTRTLSMQEYLEEHGHVTSQQYNALVKVYYAFRMNMKT